jgi:prepilin-type N-terminal cleavage/methylation domain-containing protein
MVKEMRKLRPLNRNLSGFTLIELLMAILLIAILATIAITQFTNFSKEAKNSTTKENLGILRNGIQRHFGTMRLRCNIQGSGNLDRYPPLNALNKNDITEDNTSVYCNHVEVESIADRYFVAGGIPENPWSNEKCTPLERRTVQESDDSSYNMNIGNEVTDLKTTTNGHCGWIYNEETGRIKANSNNNDKYPNAENLYESAY